MLREYYKKYKPKVYLFDGQRESNPYDARSLHLVLKQAIEKAGIKKPVSLHWLRHSHATYLLESRVDIRILRVLLGHKAAKLQRFTPMYAPKTIKFKLKLKNLKSVTVIALLMVATFNTFIK